MITSVILAGIQVILEIIILPIRALPDVVLDAGIGLAIVTATENLANINTIIPLTTLFAVVGSIFIVELLVLLYKVIMWGIRRLPTQS